MIRPAVVQPFLVPLASLSTAVTLFAAGLRPSLVVALPVLVFAALSHRLPRPVGATVSVLLGVLTLAGGLIAHGDLLIIAGLLYLPAGIARGWGVNRGRSRGRAWTNRGLTTLGAIVIAFFVVYPTLLTVDYLAKPRAAITDAALGLPHQAVTFTASDGVRLSGWYVPARNGAAIVLVHGGGGDRRGTIRHARMLAHAGYGVLLYDARGRGKSAGHENAFGWQWDRDVRGAVSYLSARGIRRIGSLGLSTGAEAVVTEAAADPRVQAVVADGLQGRTSADVSHLPFGDRISIEPAFVVAEAEIELVSGDSRPLPLMKLVHDLARTRPLLLIGTVGFERELDRAYTSGTRAQLWQLPRSAHTHGLEDHPNEYAQRVLALFDRALV